MTVNELTNETWNLWCDYYRDGDLSYDEIIDIINSKIKALLKEKCAEQRGICWDALNKDLGFNIPKVLYHTYPNSILAASEPNFD